MLEDSAVKHYRSVKESLLQDTFQLKSKIGFSIPKLIRYKEYLLRAKKELTAKFTTIMSRADRENLKAVEDELELINTMIVNTADVEAKIVELQRFIMESSPRG